jgi:hypothetical protein
VAFARHLSYLVAQWICANLPGQGCDWALVPLARRIRNWIFAADLARDNWERDSRFLQLISESLSLQGTYLLQHLEPKTAGRQAFGMARALVLLGRYFGPRHGEAFRVAGHAILTSALETQLGPDGVLAGPPPETQLDFSTALTEQILFADGLNAAERGRTKGELCAVLEGLEGMLLPDGTLPLFGAAAGATADPLADLFAVAAALTGEPRWKSLAGRSGILPYMLLGEEGKARFTSLPEETWIPTARVSLQRAVYRLVGEPGSALLIKSLPPAAAWDHQDYLSYELLIRGQRVVVDSGAFNPEGESWDPYYASPHAHNVLLVDGQASRGVSANGLRAGECATQAGEGFEGLGPKSRGFRFQGLAHKRAWFCLDGRFWLVLDRLEGPGKRHCLSLLHFYPTFEIAVGPRHAVARSRSAAFAAFPLGGSPAAMTATRGAHAEFPGWYSADFGVRYPASVLALEWGIQRMPWLGGYLIVP